MTDTVIIPQRFWLRRGIRSDLTLVDEVLYYGEVCFEFNDDMSLDPPPRFKVGDGVTPWHALPYIDIQAARELPFDPTGTALTSTNVQDALVELAGLGGGGGAALATTVVDGDTTHAPDGNAVYDHVAATIAALTTIPHVPVLYASGSDKDIATLAAGAIIDPGGGMGSVSAGDRVLLPHQTDPTQNGIYDIHATGPATRSSDADTGAKLLYAQVYVQSGSHYGGKTYRCTTPGPITLGTDAITWVISSNGAINDTDNLPEGLSNKYYTDERAQDAVANMFGAGSDIDVVFTYDDAGNRMGVATVNTRARVDIAIVAGVATLDCSLGNFFYLALTADATLNIINPPTNPDCFILKVLPSGGHVLTLPAGVALLTGGSYATGTALHALGLMTMDGGTTFNAVVSQP